QKDSVDDHQNTALVTTSSSHPSKLVYYCENGVHNPLNTSHKPSKCYVEFPHLLPKKKEKDNQSASTHLSSTQALVTSAGVSNQKTLIIINSAATHHMFNNKSMFTNLKQSSPFIISTGDPTSILFSEGTGSVNIMINGKTLTLENCIFVPKISHNLISLLELFKNAITIEKLPSDRFVIKQLNEEILSGKISNRLMTVQYEPIKALISIGTLWHQRLRHPSNQVVKMLGLPLSPDLCEICLTGKSSLLPFSGSFDEVHQPLDCIHLYIVGPISPSSNTGLKYLLTIVDQFTLFKSVVFLKAKSKVFDEFVKWKAFSENFHNTKIKRLVSDRGGEFENERFKQLATSCGFIHTFSPAETPEHNGFAERANRTILDKARCLLIRSSLPQSYWAEAVNTATFLSNLIPTVSRNNKSTFVLWAKKLPRLKRLKTFGCKAFILVQQKERDWKLAPTSEEGILLGSQNDNSSYWILQLRDKKVVVTRHALFIEDNFPFLDRGSDHTDCSRWVDTGDEADVQPSPPPSTTEQPDQNLFPNNPQRIKVIGPRHPTLIRGDVDQSNILAFPCRPKALISVEDGDPLSYSRAVNGRKDFDFWIAAIEKELDMMKNLEVWDVVKLEPHYKIVGTAWVSKKKNTIPAASTEYKARLCAQGFVQTFGEDYFKTFAPTGRMHSLRTLIAFSVTNSLKFQQLDIRSAFLNARLEEEVYLGIMQGLNFDKKTHCLKLKKAIYGSPTWLFFHVDDIAVFGKDVDSFKSQLKTKFDVKDMDNAELMLVIQIVQFPEGLALSQAHYIESLLMLYGMENCRPVVTPMVPGLHLSEASLEQKEAFKKLKISYCSAVGSLSYLSVATRPDISFVVTSLSQFLELPGIENWKAFLHVLRYLRGASQQSIVYSEGGRQSVQSYCDTDWGNCHQTQRSVTGFGVNFNDCLIIWKTRKQSTVSLSTAEAEYRALTDLTTKLLWLRQFLQELLLDLVDVPIDVFSNNQACINTANSNSNSNNWRMKHVGIQLHFIREVINQQKMRITYVPTQDMLADFMTKPISRPALKRCFDALHVLCLRARGDVEINTADG
ncbi:hypothetical protein O181_075250, partial [Austropuccinia psidii MF-1]|nr:hypothetical protein [Austropuccinia psidii MF-1]